MRTSTDAPAQTGLTQQQRAGLGIAVLLAIGDVTSAFLPGPEADDGEGPPLGILVLGGILGAVTLLLAVRIWRTGDRRALRGLVGLRVVSALTALPAFFVDVPAWVKLLVAVAVLLTLLSAVLLLGRDRDTRRVVD